jgi:hypothetical protein
VIFAIIPNILGQIIVPSPHYGLIIENMFSFSSGTNGSAFEKMWFPSSLGAWLFSIKHYQTNIFNVDYLSKLAIIPINIALWIIRAMILIILSTAASKARFLKSEYLFFIVLVCLIVSSSSTGGYSLLLLIPFLYCSFDRPYAKWFCTILFLVFFPFDIQIGPGHIFDYVSFLSGKTFTGILKIPLSSFLRPIYLIVLLGIILADLYYTGRNVDMIEEQTDTLNCNNLKLFTK